MLCKFNMDTLLQASRSHYLSWFIISLCSINKTIRERKLQIETKPPNAA